MLQNHNLGTHITVVPAYGRDYKTSGHALAAWKSGKDFLLASLHGNGYISIRDMAPHGFTKVTIRFNRKADCTILEA